MQFPERCNCSQKPFGCSEMAIKNGIVQIYKDGISSKTAILGKGGTKIISFCEINGTVSVSSRLHLELIKTPMGIYELVCFNWII